MRRWCSRNSLVTTAQMVWLPRSSDPVVQQSIRELLRSSRSQLVQNAYFEMLRDQARVENFFAEQVFKNAAK